MKGYKHKYQEVFVRDGGICQYCGMDLRPFEGWRNGTVDHIQPLCLEGTDETSNLVLSCWHCNAILGRKRGTFEEKRAIVQAALPAYREKYKETMALMKPAGLAI